LQPIAVPKSEHVKDINQKARKTAKKRLKNFFSKFQKLAQRLRIYKSKSTR
jgi:hypothetical protein